MRLFATNVLALLAAVAPACAQSLIAHPWGLQLPTRFIDFGAGLFPDGTPVSNQFPGIAISHGAYFTSPAPNNNVAGGFLGNDVTAGPPDTLILRFHHSITDVSFVYHQIGTQTPTNVRAKFMGGTVELFTILWNETQPNNFFGFIGGCLLDEIQIDFVGDFRIDELAYHPAIGASCTYFNGSGINLPAFFCAEHAVLGGTWHGTIATTPSTLLTALVYSPVYMVFPPIPLFGGELLVDPSQGLVAITGMTDYTLAIPASSSWVGTTFAFQGVRLDSVGGSPTFVPTNAQLVLLGM